jgi:hypothetical protein
MVQSIMNRRDVPAVQITLAGGLPQRSFFERLCACRKSVRGRTAGRDYLRARAERLKGNLLPLTV